MREQDRLQLAVTFLFGAGCIEWQHLHQALDEIDRVKDPGPGAMYPLRPTVQRLV